MVSREVRVRYVDRKDAYHLSCTMYSIGVVTLSTETQVSRFAQLQGRSELDDNQVKCQFLDVSEVVNVLASAKSSVTPVWCRIRLTSIPRSSIS